MTQIGGFNMLIKDLITLLQTYPPEQEIFGCEPSDGNGPTTVIEPEINTCEIPTGRKEQCKHCQGIGTRMVTSTSIEIIYNSITKTAIKHYPIKTKTNLDKCPQCYGTGWLPIMEDKLFIGWS